MCNLSIGQRLQVFNSLPHKIHVRTKLIDVLEDPTNIIGTELGNVYSYA